MTNKSLNKRAVKKKPPRVTGKAQPKKRKTVSKANGAADSLCCKAKGVFDQVVAKYGADDWLSFASQQRARLIREVKGLGDEIVDRIAETPVFAHREDMIQEARQCVDNLLQRLNGTSLLSRAIDSAKITRQDLLSFLNIPSHKELKQLQRKLHQMEARLSKIQGKRA